MFYIVLIRLRICLGKPGSCNTKRFLCEFRQRLIDCCLQDWYSAMASKDRLAFYSTFFKSHSLADYLFTVKKAVLRKHLVRFRLGVSSLKTHRLRYSQKTPDIFTCPFCDTNESEIHFLLVCPKYKTLRETYLPSKFYNRPSAFKMAVLLADTRLSFPLAVYISKAFELRASSISNAILA